MILTLSSTAKDKFSKSMNLGYEVIAQVAEKAIAYLVEDETVTDLSTGNDDIDKAFEVLVHLFLESGRNKLSQEDFVKTLSSLNVEEKTNDQLSSLYACKAELLRDKLCDRSYHDSFHNLDWRLSAEVGSKYLQGQVIPLYELNFEFIRDGKRISRLLQTDPTNLMKLTSNLELALQEMNSSYMRRAHRTFGKS